MRERPAAPLITGVGQHRVLPQTADLVNYLVYGVILLLLALAGWLYLSTTVRVDGLAAEIHQLEGDKEALRRTVVGLQGELAIKESLERVHREASRLGYIEREASRHIIVSVDAQQPAAREQQLTTGTLEELRRWWRDLFGPRSEEGTP